MKRRHFLRVATTGGGLGIAGCNGSDRGERADHSSNPAIEVESVGLRDGSPPIVADGLAGYDTVTFTSRTRSRDGLEWRAEATFETGADGRVNVSEQQPLSSRYYTELAPMGLIWSMRPAGTEPTEPVAPDVRFVPPKSAFDVTLTVEYAGEVLDSTTTTRRLHDPLIDRVDITAEKLFGEAYLPPGDGPVPGVIHLHGAGGRPFTGLARLLASRGVATFALQYFGEPEPLPASLREIPVEYVERAIEWFGNHDRVADGAIGLFGFSRGGSLALLAATQTNRVACVVGWVPSGIVYEGLDPDRTPAGTAPWTVDGEPVPYLPLAEPDMGPPPNPGLPYFEPPFETAGVDRLTAVTIPVEAIEAPLYLVSATDDRRWPSTRLSKRIVDRLEAQDYSHLYRHDVFEGAGHFLIPPHVPTAGTMRTEYNVFGGTPSANAIANAEGWSGTLAFLSAHLNTSN